MQVRLPDNPNPKIPLVVLCVCAHAIRLRIGGFVEVIHHRFTNQKICLRAAAGDAPDVSLVGDLIARLKPQKPIVCSVPALDDRTIKYIRALWLPPRRTLASDQLMVVRRLRPTICEHTARSFHNPATPHRLRGGGIRLRALWIPD